MEGGREGGRKGGREGGRGRTAQGGIGAGDDSDGVCGPAQAL